MDVERQQLQESSLLDPKLGEVNFFNNEKSEMESIDELEGDELKKFRRNIQMIFRFL